MSPTPTVTASTPRARPQRYPADYDIYTSDVATTTVRSLTTEKARRWPNHYRRIPAHRPINRNLDQSQRKVYTSSGERVFLTMMFTGLQVNVVSPPL
jgi:hypothetical protein